MRSSDAAIYGSGSQASIPQPKRSRPTEQFNWRRKMSRVNSGIVDVLLLLIVMGSGLFLMGELFDTEAHAQVGCYKLQWSNCQNNPPPCNTPSRCGGGGTCPFIDCVLTTLCPCSRTAYATNLPIRELINDAPGKRPEIRQPPANCCVVCSVESYCEDNCTDYNGTCVEDFTIDYNCNDWDLGVDCGT